MSAVRGGHRNRALRSGAGLIIAAAALAACTQERPGDEVPAATAEQPEAREQTPAAAGEDVLHTAIFRPVGEADEFLLRGTARILAADGDSRGFRIAIDLENVPAGEHAWEIRRGTCEGGRGEVVVPFTTRAGTGVVAEPLEPDELGAVQAIVTVPPERLTLEAIRSDSHALVLHAYPELDEGEESAPMACADLGA